MTSRPLAICTVALLLVSCTLVSEDHTLLSFEAPPPVDTEPPRVIFTEPEDGAVEVLRSLPIRVRYDEPIDPASYSVEDFHVQAINQLMDLTFSYRVDEHEFVGIPSAPLPAYEEVVVTVPPGVADFLGQATADPFVLRYTTGATADGEPPLFDGITEASDGGDNSAILGWEPATDGVTPADSIVYIAYVGSPNVDYSLPVARSAPGATSVRVPYLAPGTSYSFAVRATDASQNEDTNSATRSAQITGPTVSFAAEVEGLLDGSCAVLGCHTSPDEPAGLDLRAGAAWQNLVGQPSPADPSYTLVEPGDWRASILARVLVGKPPPGYLPMPLVGSLDPEDIDHIVHWIVQGAANN
jgi:hypothetical protein